MTAIYTTSHAGQTASRKSAGHIAQLYTHAVWTRGMGEAWECRAYCSRLDLAHARAGEFSRAGSYDIAIEPVSCEIKLTKKQQAFMASRAPHYVQADSHYDVTFVGPFAGAAAANDWAAAQRAKTSTCEFHAMSEEAMRENMAEFGDTDIHAPASF